MIDFGPVFVLGNSPRLPVDALDCLDGLFTVGVNRILKSGFTPTVLVWVDGNLYRQDEDNKALMDDTKALLVCDQSVAYTQYHHGLYNHVGDAALAHNAKPHELVCNGSTGCCAARWAHSLGCSPVYLVGMDAQYAPNGDTDFYGVNQWHHRTAEDNGTLFVMRAEVERLRLDLGPDVVEVFDDVMLRQVASECEPVDQDELKRRIVAMIERLPCPNSA